MCVCVWYSRGLCRNIWRPGVYRVYIPGTICRPLFCAATAHRVCMYTDHHLEWCRRRACIHSPLQTYVFRRARDEYAFVPPLRNALQQWRHHRAHTVLYMCVCAYIVIYAHMMLYIIIHFSDRHRRH